MKGNGKTEEIRKIERKILRTCIKKKHIVAEQYRLMPRDEIYKEIEPITNTIRKKWISFFGHIYRMPEDKLKRRIIEKLYTFKIDIPWYKDEIKEYGRFRTVDRRSYEKISENYTKIIKDNYERLKE